MVDANSAVDRRPRSYCSEFIFIGLAASRCDTTVMNADLGSLVWHGADDRCGLCLRPVTWCCPAIGLDYWPNLGQACERFAL